MSLFAGIPPEITSAKMYSGPGSESMLAAAAAWNAVSAELRSAATNYDAVIKTLISEGWFGPSSAKMAASVAPYLEWLNTTAAQAEQAGAQTNAAAAAYEAAFAATVPPAVVTANRTQLANLVASNIFGQNTGLIAANEAQYGDMWAQDASAMTNYSAASTAATQKMTLFQQPQSDTTSDGTALQADSVLNASSNAPAVGAATTIWEWLGLAPNTNTSTTGLAGLMNFLDGSDGGLVGAFLNNASLSGLSNAFTTNGILNPTSFIDAQLAANSIGALDGVDATTSGLGVLSAGLGGTASLASVTTPGAAAAAGLGQGSLVGTLSVPPAWGATGAAITPVASTTQVGLSAYHSFGSATPMVMEEAGAVGMPGVPLAGVPAAHEDEFADPIYGFRPRVIGRPPAAG
ncbi:PPE family protein [Mycobacterium shigaense]|uniref:Putative PPE family protein PPE61 n=2 Tax=Mycobacterium shigaense TaxID=722731 RepID=A0A1Z4EIA5_9MYCO|nr:PPE family protein [Mycobacterium shigaense]MEA1123464.1 PPE family protein [Mycobacterium shigaense]PRI13614.1 PPE family protein [Mycobacterium shigaense]BAX92715.1 putative PPE family protein PPE61 [Mycobacterium shigaense]